MDALTDDLLDTPEALKCFVPEDPYKWETDEGIQVARLLEPVAAGFGCHVALTGGLLYKDGPRKDCDIIVYRHGLRPGESRPKFTHTVDRTVLVAVFLAALVDFTCVRFGGRVVKLFHPGTRRTIDLIFPECDVLPGEPENASELAE